MSGAIDAQKAFSGTVAPEGADVLDEAKLTAWMEANVEGFQGPLTQSKFAGGQSNPTYKISAPSGNYVLRRKPLARCSRRRTPSTGNIRCRLASIRWAIRSRANMGCVLMTAWSAAGSMMGMVDGHTIWDGSMPGSTPKTAARPVSR